MIHPSLLKMYSINPEQAAIISHQQGPLLVTAGPGSGKTHSLTLLAMNLLLTTNTTPDQLILCTYTEKAAREMFDRILHIAKTVHYPHDLSQLKVDTIHGICNQLVREHLHHTPLGNDYEILNTFTQALLIFEHLPQLCQKATIHHFFREPWGNDWDISKKLATFFDKITEEMVFDRLKSYTKRISKRLTSDNLFLYYLTHTYKNYQCLLEQTNCIDFAHLQRSAYKLLDKNPTILNNLHYVLVDEYQDTNYIQEQLLLKLAQATPHNNLIVVGDGDQALYRFRGATVRNILEFADKPEFQGTCTKLYLTTNYRSHPHIIDLYNHWMDTRNWQNNTPNSFPHTSKVIQPDPDKQFAHYPAILSLQEPDIHQEVAQIADIIEDLKHQGHITDYNQVALLFPSVRHHITSPYIEALDKKGISTHCPRARNFFDQPEIHLMLGCFAELFNYQGSNQHTAIDQSHLPLYIDNCRHALYNHIHLTQQVLSLQEDLANILIKEDQLELPLLDYFYRLVFHEAFAHFLTDDTQCSNLVAFSRYLVTFQNYYLHCGQRMTTLEQINTFFFQHFLCLLHADGANLPEDLIQPLPSNHVQILTIHQAKGLEFPIVIVARLHKPFISSGDTLNHTNKYLQEFYHRPSLEADEQITAFDFHRLYYVAFSRARHLLILTAKQYPYKEFTPIWSLTRPYAYADLCTMPNATPEPQPIRSVMPRYSFTGHIQLYASCPRRFQFFRHFNFSLRHSSEPFIGQAVHYTLAHIHRLAKEQPTTHFDETKVQEIFHHTLNKMQTSSGIYWDETQSTQALQQIFNYVHANRHTFQSITSAEHQFRMIRDRHILTGTIDLLTKDTHGLTITDFKTSKRPPEDSESLSTYKHQLYLYASALQTHTGQAPQRLFIYWTAEEHQHNALMEIPYTPTHLQETNHYIENIITNIQQENFSVQHPPNPHICQSCDVRHLCRRENII